MTSPYPGVATRDAGTLPSVSLILPVRNEAPYIEACVLRLLHQDYPKDRVEILVVDGCSRDGTREVVVDLQNRFPEAQLHMLDNPAGTVPHALNIGIRAAQGDVIVRIDGHTVPAPDYVASSVAALEASGAANVGGVVEPIGDTPFGMAVAVATKHPLGVGDARFRTGGAAGDVDTVPFGAFRRDVFRRVGLFDESLVRNQDYEMNLRIRQAGERIYLDPSIQFTYTPRGSVRALWRQYFQYGWWRVETARRHPRSLRWRQLIPPSFVAMMLVFALILPFGGIAAIPFTGLVAIYGGTVVAISLSSARDRASPALVALAFVTIHFGWGLGFLLNLCTAGRFPYRAQRAHVPRLDDGPEPASSP